MDKKNVDSDSTIAVLMTVHNRREATLRCLQQLFSNCLENYQICVYLVDDGSTDGTSMAVEKNFPTVKILHGDGNLYWNRGMLYAWKEAIKDLPDFFLWLNDDTYLNSDALNLMLNAYNDCGTRNAIICGSTHAVDNNNQITYGGRYHKQLLIPNGQLQKAEWLNGNCILIPDVVVDEIGILDPFFHHAKGDWEYSIRAGKKGVSLFIAPEYIGSCDVHPEGGLQPCYNPSIPLKDRLNYLSHPLGPMPRETFYYCRKCLSFGRIRGIFYIINIYLKTLMPRLFK